MFKNLFLGNFADLKSSETVGLLQTETMFLSTQVKILQSVPENYTELALPPNYAADWLPR